MFENYFDKIFCINLKSRRERWDICQKEFIKAGIGNIVRFEAIDGKNHNNKATLLPCEVGCLLSHLEVINRAKKEKLSNVLIFEDDVEFCSDFEEKFIHYLKQLPDDWDMLYFGGNHIEAPIHISKNVLRVTHTRTTHAYAIKSSIFEDVINLLSEKEKQVDMYYTDLQKKVNAYVLYPHLVWQRNDYSEIQQKNVNYDCVKNYRLPLKPYHIFQRPCDAVRRIIEKFKKKYKKFFQ